jgi:hypothetical protein
MKRHVAVLGILAILWAGAACDHGGDATPGSGGEDCGSCSDVYVFGGVPCGGTPAQDTYVALTDCACGNGPCAGACSGSLCVQMPADDTCGGCLQMSCAKQETDCAGN